MNTSRDSLRLVLVNPPALCVEDDRMEPPLGLLYIGAAAREAGFSNVMLDDMAGCRTQEEVSRNIDRVLPADVYGITAFCTTHENVRRVIARIRQQNPEAYVILGGPNPSAVPDFSLTDSGADVVIVGEGEDAMVRCLESYLTGPPIKGVLIGDGRTNIDSYPFPARDLADTASYSRRLLGQNVVSMIASRGCPHRCAYCNSQVMGGGAARVRYRSPESVAGEVESLRNQYQCFRFNDDCLTEHPRLHELLDRLAGLDIRFRVFARVSHLTQRNCEALKKAGCVHVSLGLESLNPQNLKIIEKGRQAGEEYRIGYAKDAGITVRAYFMVGLPFDTDETIQKYFRKAAHLAVDEFSVYPLIPYPGTRIANYPEDFGYTVVNPDFRDYVQIGLGGKTCFALRHENFGPEDVRRWKWQAEEILRNGGAGESRTSTIAC